MDLADTLQQAITHHKAGDLENAEQLYRAILSEQTNHPDANHNLGVLLKQDDKADSALPFFKTALESNPKQGQYWISYIDTLIHLGQYDDAQNVLNQGQSKGFKGDAVDQLKEHLNSKVKSSPESVGTQTKPLNVNAALKQAKSHAKKGQLDEARQLYQRILEAFPQNQQAKKGLKALQKGQVDKKNPSVPPQAQIDAVISLYSQGQIEEALKKSETLINDYPNTPLLYNISGACYKVIGQLEAAVKSFEQALAIKPDYADAHSNLGVTLKELGQLEAAVKSFEQALAIKHDYAEAHSNLGNTLNDLGQLEAAVKSFEQALAIKPDYADAHSNLGVTLKELGQLEAAVKSFEQALAIKPDYAEAHYNLGNTLNDLGQLEAAVKSYEQALAIKPDYAEAHYNLGNTLKELSQLDAAVKSYEQALAIKPDYAEAHYNLGNTLKELGQLEAAVKSYGKALSIDSSNQLFWTGFSNVLRVIRFKSFNNSMVPYLLQALQRPSIRPNYISRSIISMLRHHPNLHMALEACKTGLIKGETNQLADQLTSIPLLLQLMELCTIPDTEIERLLRLIRQATLRQLTDETIEPANLPFYVALALHCFTNEYVFLESLEETTEIEQLENKINSLLANNKPVPPLWVALLASYRPLHIFSWSSQLSQSNSTDSIQRILTQQIDEVREEQRLRPEIKALSTISNNVSQAVREQYEENPYPRWVNPGLSPKPKTIRSILQELKIGLDHTGQHFPSHPEILIAGCGTGQHSLGTASRFSNSSVLAVDLSLSSLSYAIRKTQELGISNIDYIHADILELHKLDRQFDLIESAGVLHHMAEPLAGWKVLVDLLRPRGLMKIGLYSEIARQHIVETRAFIEKNDYGSSQEAIRQCRVEIMEMPTKTDSKISKVLNSNDFYSLSTCRDLLFHVQEHRFTLPEIETALKELGLAFIGFELQDLQVQNRFKELDPRKESLTSLPLWHQFELDHPDTFAGMYQFWVQKT
jgi:tetratricopeptide (TPR) repeat protein/2-polyprenyl-3-methyl-5-hydroxy-6-metoxy-1,4-benzoquinol methylase